MDQQKFNELYKSKLNMQEMRFDRQNDASEKRYMIKIHNTYPDRLDPMEYFDLMDVCSNKWESKAFLFSYYPCPHCFTFYKNDKFHERLDKEHGVTHHIPGVGYAKCHACNVHKAHMFACDKCWDKKLANEICNCKP